MITAEAAIAAGWLRSSVCPPCRGCGQPPRRRPGWRGLPGPAVRLHLTGCHVGAAEARADAMRGQVELARELAVSAA